jgi:hypothetical protein
LLLLVAGPSALFAADGLTVSVQIDGLSQLFVKRDRIYWQHVLHARPGRHGGGDYPTLINDYAWYPQWPSPDPAGSGPSEPLVVATEFSTNAVVLVKTAGRGPVSILQQPSAANDFTLIVSFDDALDGPDRYNITLSGLTVALLPRLSAQVACIALSWPSETNRWYQLQYSSLLTSNTWLDLSSPVRGEGTNVLYVDSVLGDPRRFYRIIPLP